MPDVILPAKYYLEHFEEFTTLVRSKHSHLMEERHHQYLSQYSSLTENAKCLLIRMINRSGEIFSKDSLIYEEISNYEVSWRELQERNFIRDLAETDLLNYIHWLKKDHYKEILQRENVPFKKSSSREECLKLVLGLNLALEKLTPEGMVVLNRSEDIEYLLFLYFGRLEQKLVLPTLRDLGIRKTSKKGSITSKFKSIGEAQSCYFYSRLKRKLRKEKTVFTLSEIQSWPSPIHFEAKEIYEALISKSAQLQPDDAVALEILRLATQYPATGQRVRLYHQRGHFDECRRDLERMMDDPSSDEELLFAEDFLQRKFQKKKLSLLTETLRSSEKMNIDEAFYRHPEFGVLNFYQAQGVKGHFAENYLWNTLFRTFFREEIDSSAHSEFDHVPTELVDKSFLSIHRTSIEAKFQETSKERLMARFPEDEILCDFIEHSPLERLFQMLTYMAEDYYSRNTGFPDLYLIQEGEVRFIEVKAEGDSLKASQIKQMRQLEKIGYEVKVLQVAYQYNENQTYVVVDLETTGSVSSWNRVTEIGAVKVRNNEVIGTFQTLLNPERGIPQNIQELTGITNQMVRGAPLFSEVAERFFEFVDGSIFVAHNASFDYGFIQQEFSRLEKTFVMPYICTKSWMRKYYPGLESYSLKSLCETFSIPLKGHHRALCDAEAASELLRLINAKRSAPNSK